MWFGAIRGRCPVDSIHVWLSPVKSRLLMRSKRQGAKVLAATSDWSKSRYASSIQLGDLQSRIRSARLPHRQAAGAPEQVYDCHEDSHPWKCPTSTERDDCTSCTSSKGRLRAGRRAKAERGELVLGLPRSYVLRPSGNGSTRSRLRARPIRA